MRGSPDSVDGEGVSQGSVAVFSGHNWMDICEDIHRYMFSLMSLMSAVCIGATSRYNRRLYKEQVLERVYACLMAFGLPPAPTLITMRRLRAVLSGSCALAILEPGQFKPGDLDVYVPRGFMESFELFLSEVGGFVEITVNKSTTSSTEYTGWRVMTIYCMKYFKHQTTGALLNVIETESSAPTAVFMFHSTFLMNYVTWNTVVCAYPRSTCAHRGLLNSDVLDLPPRTLSNVMKYFLRGFDVNDSPGEHDRVHVCGSSDHCPDTLRSVLDKGTMRATFSSSEDDTADLVDDTIVWKIASCVPCKPGDPPLHKVGFVGNSKFVATVTDRTRTHEEGDA